ncbi:MAG: HEAT repeat domain-containing protein [Candidatus Peribacteraceae bacterium]|jgi:glucose/arabinose dehydrogenase/mono/diheme cytochrome c family protein|nr:HEAT repeat domain-containing protein [Candidatus Peribacteraceae bacterium]|tara:strand:+ start:8186 stop:11404 length:3219 start_codon:yes stop_codon:yes gene_type:complete
MRKWFTFLGLLIIAHAVLKGFDNEPYKNALTINKGTHIVLIGNNLCSRMMNSGHFETEVHLRYPKNKLTIRNMCDGGNTPGFRPHSGRLSPWAFPGAEEYNSEYMRNSDSQGHFETPDEWLTRLKADVIIAFFGYNESFRKEAGVKIFEEELGAFIRHSLSQKYNGETAPQLAIVSPIAFQDLSYKYDLPNSQSENKYLLMYKDAMKRASEKYKVIFIDVFTPSITWFQKDGVLTIDGFQMNDKGYKHLSLFIAEKLFPKRNRKAAKHEKLVREAVLEKNWMWHNDFKIPNGVHVFGRRYKPYGPDNYPSELTKIREMTVIRDKAIWAAIRGKSTDLTNKDRNTSLLTAVETNYKRGDFYSTDQSGKMVIDKTKKGTQLADGNSIYLSQENALEKIKAAPGYKIELFASEKEFPDLANPVQLSFDNKGRLWVATMPTYPHYRPGDKRPDDKLIILEDNDRDGRADNQIIFADGLHIPVGFEFSPEGVYVSQGTNLTLFSDTDGDDKFDKKQIVLSGFDDHDTHHTISAFCADPSGALYMGQGVFLHSNIETAYGPVHGTNGGFFRYSPQRRHLERTVQNDFLPNPWGIAFDRWGQNFFCDTSGPPIRWMMPATIKPLYGVGTKKTRNLVPKEHQVRPTSGLEFVSSRHFPEEVQGDLLVNNTIGFLGTKQHAVFEDGTGYRFEFRQDLIVSEDGNFRPVDMEFAPDGSLYIVDWHNLLIGHMQHNARDPLRDHSHGRIYRITYPDRPLVKEASVAGASIKQLLDNLKLPEYRTRYRTRRELRGRDANEVLPALKKWVEELDDVDPQRNHHLLEALWVTWGLNKVDEDLLKELLISKDHRVRAAAIRVLRYSGHQVDQKAKLMKVAAQDEHGRVRLEAITAASWLEKDQGIPILTEAKKMPLDDWMDYAHQVSVSHINDRAVYEEKIEEKIITDLTGSDLDLFKQGWKLYNRNGLCITCHQVDGKGLSASGYPSLADTDWVIGNEERLIKILLKGLYGPLEVNGEKYSGVMASYGKLLKDEDIASVLTYIRNSFGNQASVITQEKVASVRLATRDRANYFTPEELLEENIKKK